MNIFTKCFITVCVISICLFALPFASADDWNRKTIVTFSGPVEVPGVGAQTLPAGTYVFKIFDSPSDRHIVQIFNQDETHIFTTILAIPNYRLRATDKTVMTFKERAQGEPQALRAWFYPGRQWGEEFVYPKSKALELAKIADEPVLYTPVETASVEDLKTAPVQAITPSGETIALAEVVQTPPVETAEPAKVAEPVEVAKVDESKSLPQTAGYLPLLGGLGLLSLGVAGLMRKYLAL